LKFEELMKHKKQTKTAYSNFIEISIDPTLFNNFSNDNSMSAVLSNLSSSDEFKKLRNELIKELLNIIENDLTEKQRDVIKLTYIEGKTQNERSQILGKCQPNVSKSIAGNIDYNNNKKRYGGALKKINIL